jgi:hypothetical protein
MVVYDVYEISLQTKRGTFRKYLGYTGNAAKREDKLNLGGVGWTACLKKGTLKMRIVAADVGSKAVALALEAWHAAKAILRDPEHVRGGPWLSVRALSASSMVEVSAVAGCRSVMMLGPLAEELGSTSRLYQHLKDLKFILPDQPSTSASSSSSSKPASPLHVPSAKGRAKASGKQISPKARAKARKAKAITKSVKVKDLALYIRTRRLGTRSDESGNQYRTRTGLAGKEFIKNKYGKQPAKAKKKHWETYSPMRCVLKRPAAR